MNSCLKKFVKAEYPLREFISSTDLTFSKMRHTELQHDYTSKHTSPQLPPRDNALQIYYEQCGKVFTRELYYKVAEQISKKNAYYIINCQDEATSHIFSLGKFPQGDLGYKVTQNLLQQYLNCTCLLFKTNGYPCRYIWAVMKFIGIRIIPDSLIIKR
ncbi:FHY3/FAR1 family [Trema orientale]|uniref:FHY3/FAR1 family n=1 Tax=Trema orientale TaxID=63057 RepID=A0A2P5FFA6_TREOI|nr:FHY3/FAR1 family [Trema orientale]